MKKKLTCFPLFFCALLPIITCACKNTRQSLTESINSLVGQNIIMPKDIVYFNESNHVEVFFQNADYKILIYLPKHICSTCKIKEMRMWEEVCVRFADLGVPTLVLVDTEDISFYIKEVAIQQVRPVFAYDIETQFETLNKLPDDPQLQAFLLKGNTIILVGNPFINPRICELFLTTIGEK